MTFGMQKDDKITFLLEMFQNKVICKKAVSKGWCKESHFVIQTLNHLAGFYCCGGCFSLSWSKFQIQFFSSTYGIAFNTLHG